MIKMNLPDFQVGLPMYETVINIRKDHPEIFYEDTELVSVFGCFSGAIWNGGGTGIGKSVSREKVERIVNFYNYELHLPLRFTFTNPLLTKEHCYDTYCNMIAEVGHNGKNEILTSSRVLEEYLREKYPNYKYCKSIISTEFQPYFPDEKYSLTVMRRDKNNDWNFLDTIPQNVRHKIEFLCTDPCPTKCPRIYSHYRDLARAQLDFTCNGVNVDCSMNHLKTDFPHLYMRNLDVYIDREKILKDYLPRGFCQFKVSGRGSPMAMSRGLLTYMIKPEYHEDMLGYLLEPYIDTRPFTDSVV